MDMTKKWILEIVAMFCVMLGCYKASAKDFHYVSNGHDWGYLEEDRTLNYLYKLSDDNAYIVYTYDVSEEEAWKIINGEEFPTFELVRHEFGDSTYIYQIPARDYSKMVK